MSALASAALVWLATTPVFEPHPEWCGKLGVAAEKGQLEVLTAVPKGDASLEEVGTVGYCHHQTPLMMAAAAGQLKAVQLLLEKGADRDRITVSMGPLEGRINALCLAVFRGQTEVADYLRKLGATDTQDGCLARATKLARYYERRAAATDADERSLVELEENETPGDPRLDLEHHRCNPLANAARAGHAKTVAALLDRGATCGGVGWPTPPQVGNPLLAAGRFDLIARLLPLGFRLTTTDRAATAAIKRGDTAWVDQALALPPAAHADLPLAALAYQLDDAKLLERTLATGKTIDSELDRSFCTVLRLAVEARDAKLVKRLVAAGADPAVMAFDQFTALDVARELGDEPVLAALEKSKKKDAAPHFGPRMEKPRLPRGSKAGTCATYPPM